MANNSNDNKTTNTHNRAEIITSILNALETRTRQRRR